MNDHGGSPGVSGLKERSRIGLLVASWLAVLTGAEYLIAINVPNPVPWLIPFIFSKSWLILRYFMHFRDLVGGES